MTSSNNGDGGAASAASSLVVPEGATVAQLDRLEAEAQAAIDSVSDPDDAELLLRQITVAEQAARLAKVSGEREQRWRGLRLLAEHRYGELLPPKRPGPGRGKKDSHAENLSGRNAASRARKVAAVPKDVVEEYVATDPKPTRAGLLRDKAPEPKPKPAKAKKTTRRDTAPVATADRLQGRVVELRGRHSSVRKWTNDDLEDVELLARVILRSRAKYSSKRLHDLVRRRGSRLAQFEYQVCKLVGVLEQFDVADFDLADPYELADLVEDLVSLEVWMDRSLALATARLDDDSFEEKQRRMRDPNGRTAEEHRSFVAVADRQRRQRDRRLLNA